MEITIISCARPWKIYDSVFEHGDIHPLQNSLARTTRVELKVNGFVYFGLLTVGSLPSRVYLICVPSGASSGRLSVRETVWLLVNTLPFTLNTGSPNTVSDNVPQFAAFGVGVS